MILFWFNRFTEHWVAPQRLDLVEQARRGRLQVVQTGTFGPQFYGNADDDTVDRGWVGMPLQGIRANLEYMAELIPRLQDAGARVVGQMSMSWHYGDHERGKGLFGIWPKLWADHLPGKAPCADALSAQQWTAEGEPRRWSIEGRPYYAYSGCMCNPHWLATLSAMLDAALDLGVDGINVHHNFESFCACEHCRREQAQWLQAHLSEAERVALYASPELAEASDLTPREDAPSDVRARFAHELQRAVHHRRKAAFDEVFTIHGRARNPDLLLANWYHKYDFAPSDERSLLPPELWGRDEDYIWYSQGANKGTSRLSQGWLADMGLPARFAHAAGGGRPFVINKYDYKRWRLSIAEAAAHHFAAPAFHWSQEADADFAVEDYTGPVFRYQRFLADSESLIHPASPWSQIGLVYPRRGELAAEARCTSALRRLGRVLEDGHLLFDMLLDHQIEARLADARTGDPTGPAGYRLLILPDVARLSDAEVAALQAFVARGGRLLCTGNAGSLDEMGAPRQEPALAAREGIVRLGCVPMTEQTFELQPGTHLERVPELDDDPFAEAFLGQVESQMGDAWLSTDAPWFVRLRAWRPDAHEAIALHWVNYRQDEEAAIEVPCPVGPLSVRCRLPEGRRLERVEWHYPEMGDVGALAHEERDGVVEFRIPQVIVYGISVLRLAP